MKTIIAGGRHFDDTEYFLDCINNHEDDITEIISGGAKGADAMGELLASCNKIPLVLYKAEWDKYGRAAGHIRNKKMADNAEFLLAFWDGKSKGTHNMIITAKKLGLKVVVYNYG